MDIEFVPKIQEINMVLIFSYFTFATSNSPRCLQYDNIMILDLLELLLQTLLYNTCFRNLIDKLFTYVLSNLCYVR